MVARLLLWPQRVDGGFRALNASALLFLARPRQAFEHGSDGISLADVEQCFSMRSINSIHALLKIAHLNLFPEIGADEQKNKTKAGGGRAKWGILACGKARRGVRSSGESKPQSNAGGSDGGENGSGGCSSSGNSTGSFEQPAPGSHTVGQVVSTSLTMIVAVVPHVENLIQP
jgi:hypothetical protein